MVRAIIFDCFGVLYVQSGFFRGMARNAELIAFMQHLHKRYKIGMMSNINRATMDGFFDQNERAYLFDSVVLSGDVGVAKPHPNIYLEAAKGLGVKPEEVLFIDDNENNCAGAQAVGMTTVHHTSNSTTIAALQTLTEQGKTPV